MMVYDPTAHTYVDSQEAARFLGVNMQRFKIIKPPVSKRFFNRQSHGYVTLFKVKDLIKYKTPEEAK